MSNSPMPEKTREHILPLNALFQSILDASPNSIQAYKAVRNGSGNIINFEGIYFNKQGHDGAAIGALVLGKHSTQATKNLFEKYKHVVETGEPAQFEWSVPANGVE